VDVILDLVELVRQQEVVAATNVQKPRTTIADLAKEHALRVQSKIQQLQVHLPASAARAPAAVYVSISTRRCFAGMRHESVPHFGML